MRKSSSQFSACTAGILLSLAVYGLSAGMARACFTPDRAAALGEVYPDWDFATMMHDMHGNQPYVGFTFRGAEDCSDGMIAGIFECSNVTLLGHLDLPDIGGGNGSDSWGWKHEPSGRYFAIVGRSNGTAFVEITDPTNPVFLVNLPSQTGSSTWRDIKTYQDHAFIVSDANGNHGMQIFDLTRLLDVSAPPQTLAADHLYTGIGSAHNVAINEATGTAYIVGSNQCGGGLHMVNVQKPLAPEFVGCFDADGYTHDVQCVIYGGPDKEHEGKEICFASNEDTLTIVDVSNKEQPQQVSRTGYDASGYTHQGWLTEDHRYFLLDDELDEFSGDNRGGPGRTRTFIWDLTDLDAPVISGTHTGTAEAVDHNQYIRGDYSFQANYTSGLRVLEIINGERGDLEEVAYFDSYPTDPPQGSFRGAWNTYPFFDNGMILVSDINRGIFIVEMIEPVFRDGFE